MKNKIVRKKRRRIVLCLAAGLVLLALIAFDVRLRVQNYTLSSDKLAQPLRLALVTDLHSCKYGAEQKTLIDAIDAQAPDLLLLGGDLFDDVLRDAPAETFVRAVAARYPCYYVSGNHECWSGRLNEMLDLLRGLGVTVLDGSSAEVEVRGQRIALCGIADPDADTAVDAETAVTTQLDALADGLNGGYTILLAHRPEWIGTYARYGFDLVLAGHAHGGQWRIPGLVNGLYAPNQGWLPKFAGGLYALDDTQMIVSRGLARESTRVPRIFNRPELVMVELCPAEQASNTSTVS